MVQAWILRLILRMMGWKVDPKFPAEARRSVLVAAPHTSNWDAFFMLAAGIILRLKVRFAIKKGWLRFPMNLLFRPLGAIGIQRGAKAGEAGRNSVVETMVALFEQQREMVVAVAPEGSRRYQLGWKTGFYYTALGAGVPVSLGFLDYRTKTAGILGVYHLTGDLNADIFEIQKAYSHVVAKFPYKTTVGAGRVESRPETTSNESGDLSKKPSSVNGFPPCEPPVEFSPEGD